MADKKDEKADAKTAKEDAKTTGAPAVVASNVVVATSVPAEEAETLGEKIATSKYMHHQNQLSGVEFIGEVEDSCAVGRCKHTPIAESEPRAGLEVHPSKGEAFAIPSDFPRGTGAMGWAAVVDGGGKSLFA